MVTANNGEMSRGIRRLLDQPTDYTQHPSYHQDLDHIAKNMNSEGYGAICALGPEGSNSHIVALDITKALGQHSLHNLSQREHVLVDSMHAVLDRIAQGQSPQRRIGILPIINTIGGMVQYENRPGLEPRSNLTEILMRKARVLGVVDFAVRHSLLARPGIASSDLAGREVYSHPQALSQCSDFIDEVGLIAKPTKSTSAAAAAIALGKLDPEALAISSQLAGELYNLRLVADDVGDLPSDQNVTVMAVVAKADS
jgi:chorismate mutase/prephenate dehydratase